MQGNEDNIDDYTFAMRLQQKLFDDYNDDATHEITTSTIKNVESYDYAAMQLQQMYYEEGTELKMIILLPCNYKKCII
ncbi:16041_t:CDS:2, partial [Gigaspora margarita]